MASNSMYISGVPLNSLMIFDIHDRICLVVLFFFWRGVDLAEFKKHSITSENGPLEVGIWLQLWR